MLLMVLLLDKGQTIARDRRLGERVAIGGIAGLNLNEALQAARRHARRDRGHRSGEHRWPRADQGWHHRRLLLLLPLKDVDLLVPECRRLRGGGDGH